MEQIDAKLKIMLEVLNEKKQILESILNISENQETILLITQENEEIKTLFMDMSVEKQKHIDQVVEKDERFNNLFLSMGEAFEQQADFHKDIIKQLQEEIKTVSELDIKIRAMEEKNRNHIVNKTINKKTQQGAKVNKNVMLDRYKKNTKGRRK